MCTSRVPSLSFIGYLSLSLSRFGSLPLSGTVQLCFLMCLSLSHSAVFSSNTVRSFDPTIEN